MSVSWVWEACGWLCTTLLPCSVSEFSPGLHRDQLGLLQCLPSQASGQSLLLLAPELASSLC